MGKVISAMKLMGIQDNIRAKGYLKCYIRHMGGKLMLLSSEDNEEVKKLVANDYEEDDNSSRVGETTGSKKFEGPDARTGNNLKSTNGSHRDFIGKEDNEELYNDERMEFVSMPSAVLTGGVYIKKDVNRKDTLKEMQREKMAQDTLRGDTTGSRRETSLGMGPEANWELEAQVVFAASSGLRE
ncbi:hypothetical protein Ancab_010575 [Ancistrocladus abbreviatus]